MLSGSMMEKTKVVEEVSLNETKRVILKFVNERYPEDEHALPTFKTTRENAIKNLELLDTKEEDITTLLELQELLNLMGVYINHLKKRGVPGEEIKIESFLKAHGELTKYIARRVGKTPHRIIPELMEREKA